MRYLKSRVKVTGAILVITCGISLTLFNHWEISGETWLYWLFARIFAESGRFIILDRSPLYTLYLSGFRWLGYPDCVTAEYLVTSFIVVAGMVALFKPYIGLGLSVFGALLWMPFLQVAEPPVQKMALACSCWGLVARRGQGDRFGLALFYALFTAAYMFRSTYVIPIVVFAGYDILQVLRRRGIKGLTSAIRPNIKDWPVGIVVGLLVWFLMMQSPHPWNNAQAETTKWFPTKCKTWTDAAFIQNFNWKYIERKYGTFENHDWYFTNREIFDEARSSLMAIQANPRFVFEQICRNTTGLLPGAAGITSASCVYSWIPEFGLAERVARWILAGFLLIAVVYGAFRECKDESMVLFLSGSVLMICTVVFAASGPARYMPPLIPVLVLCASWYGKQARRILMNKLQISILFWICVISVAWISVYLILRMAFRPPGQHVIFIAVVGYIISIAFVAIGIFGEKKTAQGLLCILGRLSIPLALVFFSNGGHLWGNLIHDIATDFRRGELRVMTTRPYSMKASFAILEPLVQARKGVLSLEHQFIGAFMKVPLSRVYDVWEIPPFGRLGNPVYDGLRIDRIDCVLVSHELSTGVGCGTNYQIRYQNYIKPYVKQLEEMGARTYETPGFGRVSLFLSKSE